MSLAHLRLITGILLSAVMLLALAATQFGWLDIGDAAAWLDRVRDSGPLSLILLAAAQVAAAMLGIFPASLIGIVAGTIYGVWLGFPLSAIGTLAGGALAFGLSRRLLRDWVFKRLARQERFHQLDEALGREGWRFVCLLRISPIMPFALTSYLLGVTRVTLGDYVLGTLAALPALFGYVAIGSLARLGVAAADQDADMVRFGLLMAGIAFTLLLTLRLGRILFHCGLLPTVTTGPARPKSP